MTRFRSLPKRIAGLALFAAWFIGLQPAHGLSTPAWLYTVELPVEHQGADARASAAEQGLLAVLTRVTGLSSIPRSPEVNQALETTDRLYTEYVYLSGENPGETLLRLTFERDAVLKLVKQAELPIWWTRRPTILAWVAIEEQGQRRILHAASKHPMREALQQVARQRGLELVLPVMDEIDQFAISPAEVWGNVAAAIDQASARYSADLILQGRARVALSFRGRSILGSWTFAWQGENFGSNFDTSDFQTVASQGIEPIAEQLTRRFAVLARGSYLWQVGVSELEKTQDYADMMRYLESLDFVDAVDVKKIQGGVLTLVLNTRAQADQLLELLTVEQKFVEDQLYLGRGVQLRWQG